MNTGNTDIKNENENNEEIENQNQEQEQNQERPDWLPEKFKTVQDMVNSYSELEKKLHSSSKGGDDNASNNDNKDNDDNSDLFSGFNSDDDTSNKEENKLKEIEEYFNQYTDIGFDLEEYLENISKNYINPEHRKIIENKIQDKGKIKEFLEKSKEATIQAKEFGSKIDEVFNDVFQDNSKEVSEFFNKPENVNDPKYSGILQDYKKSVEEGDLKALRLSIKELKLAYEQNENNFSVNDSVINRIAKRGFNNSLSGETNSNGSLDLYDSISDYHSDLRKAQMKNDYDLMRKIDEKYDLSRKYKKI